MEVQVQGLITAPSTAAAIHLTDQAIGIVGEIVTGQATGIGIVPLTRGTAMGAPRRTRPPPAPMRLAASATGPGQDRAWGLQVTCAAHRTSDQVSDPDLDRRLGLHMALPKGTGTGPIVGQALVGRAGQVVQALVRALDRVLDLVQALRWTGTAAQAAGRATAESAA